MKNYINYPRDMDAKELTAKFKGVEFTFDYGVNKTPVAKGFIGFREDDELALSLGDFAIKVYVDIYPDTLEIKYTHWREEYL